LTGYSQAAPVAIIAEDEDMSRLLLCQAAKVAGLEPLEFADGAAALEAALSCDPALILLDVDMPGLDGYTVCQEVRKSSRHPEVPIVMVTGHEDIRAIDRAYEVGATDYISKPVNWALLPHRLAYILRNATSVRALADRESKVRALVEAIPDSLWVVSPSGEPLWSPNNPVSIESDMTAALADTEADAPAWIVAWSLPPTRIGEVLRTVARTAGDGVPRSLEFRDDRPTTRMRSVELRFSRCENGDVLVVRQDTSQKTAAAEHIEKLAYFDPLTALPNRQRCLQVAHMLLQDPDPATGIGFIYLDLNGFKRVNDLFGHSVGDVVLKDVARALSTVTAIFERDCGHVSLYRLGGDEFVILVQDRNARGTAVRLAEACCAGLKDPMRWKQLEFFATPSIGIAVFPEDGPDVETLLKHADTAMYQSKSSGAAAVSQYSAAMSARLRDWLELESRLRSAVRQGLLSLEFQPKFRAHDNSLTGVEALLRWCDPEHGEILPSRFVPIAEETGLIIDMGAWVIRAACRQARAWLDRGIELPIAINLSGKELLFGDPARLIEAELLRLNLPARLLEIEITESVFVRDYTAAGNSIARLRQLGCQIALDDFGTGYSSLAYLSRFPPDRLKIDRSFIHNVAHSRSDAVIVNSIMSLARSLDLIVTAEGVERAEQADWLRARGCHELQGYLLSRPLAADVLEQRFFRAGAPADATPVRNNLTAS
jgi:diguanylate cyclase (GGDEF)-like protein